MVHLVFGTTIFLSAVIAARTKKDQYHSIVCMIPFFILWFFAAIRYDYGNDYFSYSALYANAKQGIYSAGVEKLFSYFLRLFPSYSIFIAFTSLLTIYPIYKIVSKNLLERDIPLALYVFCINPYLFLISLSAIRQFLAVSLFMQAVYFAYHKKKNLYCAMVLLASMVHISAILTLPAYFLINERKISQPMKFALYIVLGVLLIKKDVFFDTASRILEWIGNKQYIYYLENWKGASVRSIILSFVIFVYVISNTNKLTGFPLVCAKLYLIGTGLALLSYHINMAGRLQYYFDVYSVVAIPAIVRYNLKYTKNTPKGLINKYLLPALVLAIFAGRYYNFFCDPTWESYITYHTILGAIR